MFSPIKTFPNSEELRIKRNYLDTLEPEAEIESTELFEGSHKKIKSDLPLTSETPSIFDYFPSKLVIINRAVDNSQDLVNALSNDVLPFYYDDTDDYASILDKLNARFPGIKFSSIGWFNHGAPDRLMITSSLQLSKNTIATPESSHFWRGVASHLSSSGRLDLLGCSIAASKEGKKLVTLLEGIMKHKVAASSKIIGSGADLDWLLDTDNVDAGALYFRPDSISNWQGSLPAPFIPATTPYFDGVSTGVTIAPIQQNYTEENLSLSFDLQLCQALQIGTPGAITDSIGNQIYEWQTLAEFSWGSDFMNTTIEFSPITGDLQIRQGNYDNPDYAGRLNIMAPVAIVDGTAISVQIDMSTGNVYLNGSGVATGNISLLMGSVTATPFVSRPGSYPHITLGYSLSTEMPEYFHGKINRFSIQNGGIFTNTYTCNSDGTFSGPTTATPIVSAPSIKYNSTLYQMSNGYNPTTQRLAYTLNNLSDLINSQPSFYVQNPDGTGRLISLSYPNDQECIAAQYLIAQFFYYSANLSSASLSTLAVDDVGTAAIISQITSNLPDMTGPFPAQLANLQAFFAPEQGKAYSVGAFEILTLMDDLFDYLKTTTENNSSFQLSEIPGSLLCIALPSSLKKSMTLIEDKLSDLSDQVGLCVRTITALNLLQNFRLDPNINVNERNEISVTLECANSPTLTALGDQWIYVVSNGATNIRRASRVHFGLHGAVLKYLVDYAPTPALAVEIQGNNEYAQYQNITGQLVLAEIGRVQAISNELYNLYTSSNISQASKNSIASILGIPAGSTFNNTTYPPQIGLLDALTAWQQAMANPAFTMALLATPAPSPQVYLYNALSPPLGGPVNSAPSFTINVVEMNNDGTATIGTGTASTQYFNGCPTAPTPIDIFDTFSLTTHAYSAPTAAQIQQYYAGAYWLFKWYENLNNTSQIASAISSLQSINENTTQEIQVVLADFLYTIQQMFDLLRIMRSLFTQITKNI